VPTFNGASYVGAAIRSILEQTVEDFELIVSDDGSSDGTPDVVAAFPDDRLRLVRNETRLGLVGNWNRCLDLARGHLVSVFHQDDLMAPENLRAKVQFLEEHPSVGLVHSNVARIDARGGVLSEYWSSAPTPDDEGRHDGREFFRRLVTGANIVCASSVMMRRAAFEQLGGFDPRLPFTADWEMWLRIALFHDVGYLTQPLVRYRFHDGMETARFPLCQQLEQAYLAKTLVMEKYPERVPDVDPLRRRLSQEYRDRALAQARRELGQGRPGSAGEYLRVALVVSERRGHGQSVPYGYRPRGGQASRPDVSILTVLEGPAPDLLVTATAIQDQSLQSFEWIVVAGSVQTADVPMLEGLSRTDPRIRVIASPDLDPTTATQLGAEAAGVGQFWGVSSGDVLEPTALEQSLWALESGDRKRPAASFETIRLGQPFHNPLEKPAGTRRVLLMLSWLDVGGVEKFNLDLIGQLLERRYQISICTTLEGDHPWFPRFARLTPDIFHLPAFLRPEDFPRFVLYLIESRGIDVVLVSNSYLAYQLLPFLRSRCPDVTFVDYVHMETEHWRNGGFARASVDYQELLDLTIVSTEHLRRWMVQRGSVADRIEVCHTNVETELWNPARFCVEEVRRGLAIPDDVPMILYAARIVPQKRPRLFVEVVRRLAQKEGLAFACVVAGEGSELPALRQLVAEHGLEGHVRFVGTVTSERMQTLQAAADIFLLPSSYEGLSLALYEAMAMETVPVTSDVGGQRELVTADCGIVIPLGDDEVDRYVAALRELIQAPTRRREMAAAGRARVTQHFALETMGPRMVELLERAVALSQSSPRAPVGEGLGLECATLAIECLRLEAESETHGRRAADATATVERLQRHTEELARRVNADVTQLSGEEIARSIGLRRLVQALAFRLASKPGFTWLRAFRGVGKRALGG
jgi:glycosyltransferase involved in cell wall biosynthesis